MVATSYCVILTKVIHKTVPQYFTVWCKRLTAIEQVPSCRLTVQSVVVDFELFCFLFINFNGLAAHSLNAAFLCISSPYMRSNSDGTES